VARKLLFQMFNFIVEWGAGRNKLFALSNSLIIIMAWCLLGERWFGVC